MRENAGRQVGDRCFGNPAWVKDLMSEPSPSTTTTTKTNRVILVIIFPKDIKKKRRKKAARDKVY